MNEVQAHFHVIASRIVQHECNEITQGFPMLVVFCECGKAIFHICAVCKHVFEDTMVEEPGHAERFDAGDPGHKFSQFPLTDWQRQAYTEFVIFMEDHHVHGFAQSWAQILDMADSNERPGT
jgi:hypothetical protein